MSTLQHLIETHQKLEVTLMTFSMGLQRWPSRGRVQN